MESPIYVSDLNSEISFEKYYTEYHRLSIWTFKKYTVGYQNSFKYQTKENEISDENVFHTISEKDEEMMMLLDEQLNVSVDEEQGFVSISAIMPDRLQRSASI